MEGRDGGVVVVVVWSCTSVSGRGFPSGVFSFPASWIGSLGGLGASEFKVIPHAFCFSFSRTTFHFARLVVPYFW